MLRAALWALCCAYCWYGLACASELVALLDAAVAANSAGRFEDALLASQAALDMLATASGDASKA